ncbi:MAG: hypothetical protein N3A54_00520 [Patescibacteria group bacterium]|nr:hypothetical protein [Patescibacteria group bacterium]
MEKNFISKAIKELKRKNLVESEHFFKKALYSKIYNRIKKEEDRILFEMSYDFYGYRPLSTIAEEIERKWKNAPKNVKEYINIMKKMNKITESYYEETGISIVEKFLSEANQWTGEDANKIKKELKTMLVGLPMNNSLEEAGHCKRRRNPVVEKDDELEEEGASCSVRSKSKATKMNMEKKNEDESEEDEFKPKEKPKKINGKYLLHDKEEQEEDEDGIIFEQSDENVIADTDTEKDLYHALRNRWATKLENAPSFDSTVIFKGRKFPIKYLGKLGGKYKARVGTKTIEGKDVTELHRRAYETISGKAFDPKVVSEDVENVDKPFKLDKNLTNSFFKAAKKLLRKRMEQ